MWFGEGSGYRIEAVGPTSCIIVLHDITNGDNPTSADVRLRHRKASMQDFQTNLLDWLSGRVRCSSNSRAVEDTVHEGSGKGRRR